MHARTTSRLMALLAGLALLLAGCTNDGERSGPAGSTDDRPERRGYEATIRRTTDGVAHITAGDLGSLAFGQGYASAEDHSCDLADQVLKIRGERSKWFGPGENDRNLTSDFGWLALGIDARARQEWPDKSDGVHELFEGFAAGWNAYLEDAGVDGIDGWCAGQPWVAPISAVDAYAYARSVALQASGARLIEFIAGAQPPAVTAGGPSGDASAPPGEGAATASHRGRAPTDLAVLGAAPSASNAWAIGSERSADGGGLLLANPHFPWEGELRFWEVHLTIPGELDLYGAQLAGLPGVGIGFTENFAWSHTVSAGNRFTAYTVDLVPGKPTSYLYDGEERPMTSRAITVQVRQPDGTMGSETRTLWSTHYGPVLDFPGVGWTESTTITYRDANIDNDEFVDQYLAMNRAADLDEFIAAHQTHTGVPLFNTIAVSADGRAWYADTSATPALSTEAIAAYEEAKRTDPMVAIAAQNRAVLLDGSDSRFEWLDLPGARDPGLVPYAAMPKVERRDHVFNANDSYWLANATETLEGDYSPLHGPPRTARSPRTRENAVVLRDTSASGPAGADGRFDLDELAAASLANRGYTSRVLKDGVVQRCRGAATVAVPPLTDGGTEVLPAATVDLRDACEVLDRWDGRYELDRVGAALWREFIGRFEPAQLLGDTPGLWAEPFDPARPVDTPAGLAPTTDASPDPVLVNLARAVQIFQAAGHPLTASLGELQAADRAGVRVPIHGGDNADGVTNVVGYGAGSSTMEPTPGRGPTVAPRSALTADGYLINNGTSFLLAVHFGPDGPEAKVFLTYGQTQDRTSPLFVGATERFSAKDWRTVVFKNEDVASDRNLQEKTVRR
ncbi:penicillin acylase family protein [Rhabdothermincola sediminis]|uniref:penicillin acylase family protein n=1 Tax=Rhabdothermincola sediminis TaxID=2751370 RepID=UPI001AA01F24|nr:penicillin acylase family protein [Rhabdothermincola sediminis]